MCYTRIWVMDFLSSEKALAEVGKKQNISLHFHPFIPFTFMQNSIPKIQILRVLVRLREIRSFLHPGQFSREMPRREIELLENIQSQLEKQLRSFQTESSPHLQQA